MENPTNRNEWIFGAIDGCANNKALMIKHEVIKMLNRTTSMFEYKNLPETIRPKDLETQLQVNGFAIWKQVDGKLYTFTGGLGGEPNPYYLPTKAIVANPALRYNAELTIDKDCVVMLNDHYYQGFMPTFTKYATLLVEGEISLKFALWQNRIPALIQADNESTLASAQDYIKNIVDGDKYGVISSKEFFDGIRTEDFTKTSNVTDIIESIQYIKGSWFNEVGLNAAFNMKREAINEAEATLNEDILKPTLDTLLEMRRVGLEKVNAMYGTNISVDFGGVWETNEILDDLTVEEKEKEVSDASDTPRGNPNDRPKD